MSDDRLFSAEHPLSFDSFGSDDRIVVGSCRPLTREVIEEVARIMLENSRNPPPPPPELHHPKCVAMFCNGVYCDCGNGSGYVATLAFRSKLEEKAPYQFEVTDDYLDAPDGAIVFIDDHACFYERSGMSWVKRPGWHPERS